MKFERCTKTEIDLNQNNENFKKTNNFILLDEGYIFPKSVAKVLITNKNP